MNNHSQKIVAFFDFDGTLAKHDTLVAFVLSCVGWPKFILKGVFVLPSLMLYMCGFINNEQMKGRFLTVMLRGYSYDYIDNKAKEYVKKLDRIINQAVYNKLEYHLEHQHTIILISANLEIYLQYFAKRHHIDHVIATKLAVRNNKITGKLLGRNCYGAEKVKRIQQTLASLKVSNSLITKENNIATSVDNKQIFDYSYAYGNSRGDYELLNMANEGYWVKGNTIMSWSDYKADHLF